MALDGPRSERDPATGTAADATDAGQDLTTGRDADDGSGAPHDDPADTLGSADDHVADAPDDDPVAGVPGAEADASVSGTDAPDDRRVTAGACTLPPDTDAPTLGVEWTVAAQDEVTFVSVTVENRTPVTRRIRLRNRLDGPLLPPRSAGVPESGWDDAGYEGVLEASGRLALGYACPADAEEPPVAVADEGRVASDPEPSIDAETAVRRLGRASPPRDAVPVAGHRLSTRDHPPGSGDGPAASNDVYPTGSDDEGDPEPAGEQGPGPAGEQDAETATGHAAESAGERNAAAHADDAKPAGVETDRPGEDARQSAAGVRTGIDGQPDDALPPAVETWLAGAERRVERAERLSVGSLSEATAVLTAAGGVDAVAALPDELGRDARALRALARRASALATRAEAVDVPVESLRRLA